jgi:hypothetical protein
MYQIQVLQTFTGRKEDKPQQNAIEEYIQVWENRFTWNEHQQLG